MTRYAYDSGNQPYNEKSTQLVENAWKSAGVSPSGRPFSGEMQLISTKSIEKPWLNLPSRLYMFGIMMDLTGFPVIFIFFLNTLIGTITTIFKMFSLVMQPLTWVTWNSWADASTLRSSLSRVARTTGMRILTESRVFFNGFNIGFSSVLKHSLSLWIQS